MWAFEILVGLGSDPTVVGVGVAVPKGLVWEKLHGHGPVWGRSPEIAGESIFQQKPQIQPTTVAGAPKPSRRNDLSPPTFIGFSLILTVFWSGKYFPRDSWNLGGSAHRFRFSIARMVLW